MNCKTLTFSKTGISIAVRLQIQTCDNILASMEDMLGRFQGNLGNISSEIRTLQEQSQGMSVKLRNRKAFEERLGGFLDNVAISSGLIEGIVQSPVDENYQANLLMNLLIDMCLTTFYCKHNTGLQVSALPNLSKTMRTCILQCILSKWNAL